MSAPWLRLYTEMPRDPKIRRLKPAVRWLWTAVMCMARASPRPGWLMLTEGEPLSLEEIADEAGMPVKDTEKGLADIAAVGLIQREEGAWRVVRFDERQYQSDSSTARVRRYRERSKTVTGNGDETLQGRSMERFGNGPDTEAETDSLTRSTGKGHPQAKRGLVENGAGGIHAAFAKRIEANRERDAEAPDPDPATNRAGIEAARQARARDHR